MLGQLNTLYPVRYTALALCVFGFLLSIFAIVGLGVGWLALLVLGALVLLGVYERRLGEVGVDLHGRDHLWGHLRLEDLRIFRSGGLLNN